MPGTLPSGLFRGFSRCEAQVEGSSDAVPTRFGFRLFSNRFSCFLKASSGPVPPINTVLEIHQKTPLNHIDTAPQIGFAELYAVYRAVLVVPEGARVRMRVDNSGVVAGIMKGRFRNESMNVLLGLILEHMEIKNKFLDTVWVSTEEMEVLGSDGLSRGVFNPEGYTVDVSMIPKIQRLCTEMFGILESNIIGNFISGSGYRLLYFYFILIPTLSQNGYFSRV